MIYRIRVILDVDDDVLRDIEISSTSTLEDLHNAIIQSFGFLGNEMASFMNLMKIGYKGMNYHLSLLKLESIKKMKY